MHRQSFAPLFKGITGFSSFVRRKGSELPGKYLQQHNAGPDTDQYLKESITSNQSVVHDVPWYKIRFDLLSPSVGWIAIMLVARISSPRSYVVIEFKAETLRICSGVFQVVASRNTCAGSAEDLTKDSKKR